MAATDGAAWVPGIRVLIPEAALRARVAALGAEIARDYAGRELTVLCVL